MGSGSRRKFTAVRMAVLVLVGMLTSQLVPVAAQATRPQPGRVAAKQSLSGESSLTSDLFKSLGEGVAGQVGGAATGWALSAMGLSTGDSAALASLKGELNTIINQLNDIEAQLAQLKSAIQQLDCDSLAADTKQLQGNIDGWTQDYSNFAGDGTGANGITPFVPPVDQVQPWADAVLDNTNGVLNAIVTISDLLLNAGTSQGILAACLQPGVLKPPASGKIGDTAYYNQVANLVDYYYNYEARGLLLLQEAYHWEAQQASGQTLPPDQVGNVCTEQTNNTEVQYACATAIDDTNFVYQLLAEQFEVVGLPYDDANIVVRNGGTNPPLYPRSLETFTQAAGNSCPTPLTSIAPCGVTVATAGTIGNAMKVTFDGYTNWTAATGDQLTHLIEARGSQSPAAYLETNGFQNVTGKIIITSQTASFDFSDAGDMTGRQVCFLDTDRQFYCGDSDVNDHLSEVYKKTQDFPCPSNPWWQTKAGLPINYNGWYNFDTHGKVKGLVCEYHWTTQPGWLSGNNASTADQYRWPVINVGTLKCTEGRPPLNPGGVPTRCGADYDTSFNALVARPVTCGGTTYGQCSDTVDVALTGAQSGEWSSPLLKGNVAVTFSGNRASRIKGRVKLGAKDGTGSATVTFNIQRVAAKRKFYAGTVKIKIDRDRVLLVPVWHPRVQQHADGTVTGRQVIRLGRRHTYTLTWSLRDADRSL